MEKAEIKSIADYLKDIGEGLYKWDYRGITTQGHLTELNRIIEMNTTNRFYSIVDESHAQRTKQVMDQMLNGKTKNHLNTLWKLAGKKKKESGMKERQIRSQPSTNPAPTKTSDKWKIGVIGFEPTASCSQSRRSSQAELHPVIPVPLLNVNCPMPFRIKYIACITKIILHEAHKYCNRILHK